MGAGWRENQKAINSRPKRRKEGGEEVCYSNYRGGSEDRRRGGREGEERDLLP